METEGLVETVDVEQRTGELMHGMQGNLGIIVCVLCGDGERLAVSVDGILILDEVALDDAEVDEHVGQFVGQADDVLGSDFVDHVLCVGLGLCVLLEVDE